MACLSGFEQQQQQQQQKSWTIKIQLLTNFISHSLTLSLIILI